MLYYKCKAAQRHYAIWQSYPASEYSWHGTTYTRGSAEPQAYSLKHSTTVHRLGHKAFRQSDVCAERHWDQTISVYLPCRHVHTEPDSQLIGSPLNSNATNNVDTPPLLM